jgi:hypothetical protein
MQWSNWAIEIGISKSWEMMNPSKLLGFILGFFFLYCRVVLGFSCTLNLSFWDLQFVIEIGFFWGGFK